MAMEGMEPGRRVVADNGISPAKVGIPAGTSGTIVGLCGNIVRVRFQLVGKGFSYVECFPGELRVVGRDKSKGRR